MNLKKYVANRRAELEAEREKLKSASGGFTTGSLMNFDHKARFIAAVLDELDRLAEWEATGEPDYRPPMSDEEHRFWVKAIERGIEVPPEIREQL